MSDCQGRGFIWLPSSAARLPPPSPACTATSGAFYLPLANCSWEALCPASWFYIRAGHCCSSGFSPVSAFSGHAFASAVLFDCEISLGGLKSALAHSTFVIVWDLDGLLSPCPCPQTLWAPLGAGPTHFGQFLPLLLLYPLHRHRPHPSVTSRLGTEHPGDLYEPTTMHLPQLGWGFTP